MPGHIDISYSSTDAAYVKQQIEVICAVLLYSNCGGGGKASTQALSSSAAAQSPVTVTDSGASGSTQASTTVRINIQ